MQRKYNEFLQATCAIFNNNKVLRGDAGDHHHPGMIIYDRRRINDSCRRLPRGSIEILLGYVCTRIFLYRSNSFAVGAIPFISRDLSADDELATGAR